MTIEFAPVWVALAIMMIVVIGLIAIAFLIDSYIKYMEWKWNRHVREINQLVGEINLAKNNPGGDF